ncbi:hypothetical protein [uncultured Cytophaga sp.]|uniref:hypothetical protein n=1 Tax=uncultured Cytophaga sp. TaxID=160238 RepID=UPI00261DA339|nr:hypothetical protein [uncultured Cytophaga sp.]
MIKTFTQNDVVRFVYDEVGPIERTQFKSLLLIDSDFHQLYTKYNKMKMRLDKTTLEPSENVINRILMYSKSFSLQQ